MAHGLVERGRLRLATEYYRRAIDIYAQQNDRSTEVIKGRSRAQWGLGLIALSRNNHEDALAHFQAAADDYRLLYLNDEQLCPVLGNILHKCAVSLFHLDRLKRSLAALDEANELLQRKPDDNLWLLTSTRIARGTLLRYRFSPTARNKRELATVFKKAARIGAELPTGRIRSTLRRRWKKLRDILKQASFSGMVSGAAHEASTCGQMELALWLLTLAKKQRNPLAAKSKNRIEAAPWRLWKLEGFENPPQKYTGTLPDETNPNWIMTPRFPGSAFSYASPNTWSAITGSAAQPYLNALASLLEPSGRQDLLVDIDAGMVAMRILPLPFLSDSTACELLIERQGAPVLIAFLTCQDGALLRTGQFLDLKKLAPFSEKKKLLIGQLFLTYALCPIGYLCRTKPRNDDSRLEVARPLWRPGESPWAVWNNKGRGDPPRNFPGSLPQQGSAEWDVEPLLPDNWKSVTGDAAKSFLDPLWSVLEPLKDSHLRTRAAAGVRALRVRPLACYPGWHLCEALLKGDQYPDLLRFIASPGGALLLYGLHHQLAQFHKAFYSPITKKNRYGFLDYAQLDRALRRFSNDLELISSADQLRANTQADPGQIAAFADQIEAPRIIKRGWISMVSALWIRNGPNVYPMKAIVYGGTKEVTYRQQENQQPKIVWIPKSPK